MKSVEIVYKGLNLIVTIIGMLDGLFKRRFGKINWWTKNFVPSGHFEKLTLLVLGLKLKPTSNCYCWPSQGGSSVLVLW